MVGAPVIAVARIVFRVHDFKVDVGPDIKAGTFAAGGDHLWAADQDRLFGGFFHDRLGGAQDAFVLAFGKDDAAAGGAGGLEHGAHDEGGFEHRGVELALVGVHICDGPGGDAGVAGGLGHGAGDDAHQARVKGFRDQVFGAKGQLLAFVGGGGFCAGGGAGHGGDAFDAGDLHLVIDRGCACVEGPAEDEGKA